MEREVFEQPTIAEIMNRTVVSIKVDREELPAVDRVYMTTLMGLTGSGGWPMSMFLTHDLEPFFGATYIPPNFQNGRAGFTDVLGKIHEVWTADRGMILDTGRQLSEFIRNASSPTTGNGQLNADVLHGGFEAYVRTMGCS